MFSERGYGATTMRAVARRAGVSRRTARRLVGDLRDVLLTVLTTRRPAAGAALMEAAAATPQRTPPLATLIEASHVLFSAPERTWDPLDLEVLARAQVDLGLRPIAAARLAERTANARAVVAASRQAGGVDPALSDDAVAHLSMALSTGLAMLGPVAVSRPTSLEWDAMIARVGAAIAPPELLLEPDYAATTRWRLRMDIPDQPGGIARLVRALASLHAYTAYLQVVDRAGGVQTVDIGLIASPHVPAEVIVAAAESAGSKAHITTGYEDTDVDLLTRTLDGATHVVKHPEAAAQVAAALVAADEVEVIDATEGVDDRPDVLRLQWTANRHVVLHRRWAPFARTEQARASAVLRLSAAVSRVSGKGEAVGWIDQVRSGTVWIRLARPEDADPVAALHERCSARSRYQRYFALPDWRDIQLRRLAGGHRGATLVAMSRDGDIIGLGNVFPESPGDGEPDEPPAGRGTAEIALLVEDAHQGEGVGTAMLRHMLQVAAGMGFTRVVAHVLAANAGMLRLLERTGLAWRTTVSQGVTTMSAALDLPPGAAAPPP